MTEITTDADKPYQAISSKVIEKHIGVITLNRPDLYNALNADMIKEIQTCCIQFQQDSEIRVILLNGNGKHFSSGADLNWMRDSVHLGYDENRSDARQLSDMLHTLFLCPIPIVVAAQGSTYGGGLGLIATADIALSTTQSRFCFSEVKLGLIPAVISPYIIHAIGQRQANRYFLSAELFSGEEAIQLGLINQLYGADELEHHALQRCRQLTEYGPEALRASKSLIRKLSPIDNGNLNYTIDLISRLRTSKEGQEGLSAFLEKRKPSWSPSAT